MLSRRLQAIRPTGVFGKNTLKIPRTPCGITLLKIRANRYI
jgi:hypothetical protein